MATDPRDRLRSVLEDLATLLDGVREGQWGAPTPKVLDQPTIALASMRAQPGRREDLLGLVATAPVGAEAGCTAYLVATDPADDDVVRVSETWLSRRHHAASLRLPAVREVIGKAVPLIAGPFSGHRLELRSS